MYKMKHNVLYICIVIFFSYLVKMAQAQLPVFPDHDFMKWKKKESLFIDGHQLNYNKPHVQKDGTEIHYFYCNKKDKFKCKSSAKALKEDGKFSLYSYTGLHSNECIPNKSYLSVRRFRSTIRTRILRDPTLKALKVCNEEVDSVCI